MKKERIMQQKSTGTFNVGNFLKVASIRYRDREAVYCSTTGRRYTFLELNNRVNRLANGLMAMGLKKNDVAAFLCTNRSEILEIFFALAKIGVVGVPLNYRLAPEEIIELVDHCHAGSFLFDPWFGETAEKVRDRLPEIKHFVGMGDQISEFVMDYETLISESSSEEPGVEISEDDVQYFNLTSGTTGHPKVYTLTHYNNTSAVSIMSSHLDITPDDVILTAFPIFGRVGMGWCLCGILTGARNVIHQFHPTEILELIESEKVTVSNWVPAMASFIFMQEEFDKYDLSSLRALIFASSPLTTDLQKEVRDRICPNLYEYYGLQESGILVAAGPEEKARRSDSVGKLVFSADVRIVDAKGNDVKTGEIGEIIGRSPSTTSGYYKNEEKNRESFRNGWFYTGDLGRFDDEGFLYLAGRIKEMIITGGQNVFSMEVEDVIMGHPGVAECAVIGLPHKTWGEAVTAVVVKKADVDVTKEELISFVREKIAGFKTPKEIIWYGGPLPRTPTGKVTKFVLVEKYT